MKTSLNLPNPDTSNCSEKEKSVVGDSAEGATGVERAVEIGGRAGPEPTRFGDWEKGGRCIDF